MQQIFNPLSLRHRQKMPAAARADLREKFS
jgi:hypothetical protein